METLAGAICVGVGAGSLDHYSPLLQVDESYWPRYVDGIEFQEGAKADLSVDDEWRFRMLRDDDTIVRRVGGNMINAVAALTQRWGADIVSVAMALGVDDPASEAIREELERLDVSDTSIASPHYEPSESIVVRACENDKMLDRMVLGRPRSPLRPLVSEEYIKDNVSKAEIVIAASIKDPVVNQWVMEAASPEAFLAWNFGSSELRNYPWALREMLSKRPADLLSLNIEEAQQLLDLDVKWRNPLLLLRDCLSYARAVALTDGKEGLWIAKSNGRRSESFELGRCVGPELSLEEVDVKDTLGAGDAVCGAAIAGLLLEFSAQEIAENCAAAGLDAVQHVGAHEYLFERATFKKPSGNL